MSYLLVLIVIGLSTICDVRGNEQELTTVLPRTASNTDESEGVRDESFWDKINSGRSPSDRRSIYSHPSELNLENDDGGTRLTLKEFLDYFSRKHSRPDGSPSIDNDEKRPNLDDKSKSWTTVDVHKHSNHHPYEDKKGWVSLEPIPWSISKVSKWQSKYKPASERPWDEYDPVTSSRPFLYDEDFKNKRPVSITPPSPYVYHHPTESSDRYDTYHDRPMKPGPYSQNTYSRPTSPYSHRVHVEAHFPSSGSYSSTGRPYYHNSNDCKHPNHPYDDIITDGMPSNFPQSQQYDALRRKGTEIEIHPETHPFGGDGEWILLSTTKGYKPSRNRQRSLDLGTTSEPSQGLTTTKGVKLTVLPPLKGSNINMTTAHGGLLQVESTFDSVEQSKKKFDQKNNTNKNKTKKRRKNIKKKFNEQQLTTVPTVHKADPEAIMAAVLE
ncbi:uncharacterized protein LOC143193304 isoform X2 [Rhynchophorus ferrugineus]|uniref:uncharacterized protein LOC143193304 isoform X2 n=1 Tax=Rhynchophorus ferrugineus TaxID=354439 RepID=UPI003FCD1080